MGFELPARFWAKVEKTETCWLWQGSLTTKKYGQILWKQRRYAVHRLAYASVYGWPKLQLDHLCRVRNCVNPAHLEEVDNRTNQLRSPISVTAVNARKTHCIRGHAFTPDNVYVTWEGYRRCRACTLAWCRERRRKGVAA